MTRTTEPSQPALVLRMFLCVVLLAASLVSGGRAIAVAGEGAAQHSWYQDSLAAHAGHDAHGHSHDFDGPDRQAAQHVADHHEHLEPIHDVMPSLVNPDTGGLCHRNTWRAMPDDAARGRAVGCPDEPPSV